MAGGTLCAGSCVNVACYSCCLASRHLQLIVFVHDLNAVLGGSLNTQDFLDLGSFTLLCLWQVIDDKLDTLEDVDQEENAEPAVLSGSVNLAKDEHVEEELPER